MCGDCEVAERRLRAVWSHHGEGRRRHPWEDLVNGMVIVGGGLVAATAADTLRREGYDGPITIVGDELQAPYQRSMLVPWVLDGACARWSLVHPWEWYDDHEVTLELGSRAVSIDRSRREVVLDHGGRVGFDRLLLANGARDQPLDIPGLDLTRVCRVRDLDQVKAARQLLEHGAEEVAVLGGGPVALETAAAAAATGAHVTLLDIDHQPWVRRIGWRVGPMLRQVLGNVGVEVRCDAGVAEICPLGGEVAAVRLHNGIVLPSDLVLVAPDGVANDELAGDAGLEVADGIVVDATMSTTDPHIFAAGDVSRAYCSELGWHVRMESADRARGQAQVAAMGMLGQAAMDGTLPTRVSDLAGHRLEFTGAIDPDQFHEVYLAGEAASGFTARWLDQSGRVDATLRVDRLEPRRRLAALAKYQHSG